jgi:hypothetical protein
VTTHDAPGDPALEKGSGDEAREAPRAVMWAALAVGWAIIVFALHGIISNGSQSNPPTLLRLVIELNIANDALVAPLLVAAAFLCRRVLPRWALVPVQVGLIVTAVVVLYSYPLVGSWGKTKAAGPSRLPWNYAHNLIVVLAVVWLVCGGLAVWSWWRRPH